MKINKKTFLKNLCIVLISLYKIHEYAFCSQLDQLAQETKTNQAGTDMQSQSNLMFNHSADIYPQDDPTLRYVNAASIRFFQPADGSMRNGRYDKMNKTASTLLHDYIDIVEYNGTVQQPTLNRFNQYTDSKGVVYDLVGIYDEYSENDGEKNLFFIFGKVQHEKDKDTINNEPLTGYYTLPTE